MKHERPAGAHVRLGLLDGGPVRLGDRLVVDAPERERGLGQALVGQLVDQPV